MAETGAQLWALLPLAVLAALWRWRARHTSGFEALLEAAVGFAALVWAGANALSALGAFRPGVLRVVWIAAGAVAVLGLWRTREVRARWPWPANKGEWALAVAAMTLLALTLARAVLAPPNTVDVLNYHLPRQLMWLQQGSLAPFVTLNDRQNMMPPLAEAIGVQFLALTGGDRWANLPQWAAYVGLALALIVLVRRLGGSRGAAGVAALLGLLLPMAYHEASNAKNDLLSAFWITAGAAELARWRVREFAATRWGAVRLALPFTLAWLTKSTAMLFVPPLLAAGLWPWIRRTNFRQQLHVLAPAALLALVLIAPFHLRNVTWYGTPLGRHRAEDGGQQAAEAFGPRLFVSNAVRQASLHLVLPAPAWNERWLAGVRAVHRWLGVDLEDRRTTLWILKFDAPYLPSDETVAGAPVHFVFGLPILFALAIGWRARGGADRARWLAVATLAGAALFCAGLKWQPWAARLEQPLFALGLAAAVVALDRGVRSCGTALAVGAVALAGAAWWPGADTVGRTLWQTPRIGDLPREVNYYRMLPRFVLRDRALADLVARSGARHIWLQNLHDVAFPLMRQLQVRVPDLEFAGASVGDVARTEAIVALSLGATMPLYAEFAGRSDWRLVGAGTGDGIYLPAARVRELGWESVVPQFAGWSKQVGLSLAERDVPELGLTLVRRMPGGSAEISYEAHGRAMRLRVALLRPAAPPQAWMFTVAAQGRVFAAVECRGAGPQEFEVQLPSEPGVHAVALTLPADTAADVLFTRVQVIDSL